MRKFVPLFVAIASLTSAAQAAPIEVAETKVTSASLDLSTEAGADQFLARIERAATQVCGGYPDLSPLASNALQRFRACRAKAVATAVAQSGSPMVQRQFAASEAARHLRVAAR
jgi:UrcA family protein